ncbi:MAG: amidohydrolase family protein [Armatimonadia bacterium]
MNQIIDFNCDCGAYAFREYPQTTAAEVLAQARKFGVGKVVMGSARAITFVSPQPANELLAAELAELNDEAVLPCAVLNPEYPGALEDLQRCRELGFKALKLYPTYHDFDITSHATVRLAEEAAALGWPVLVTVRIEDERHHHPLMKIAPLAMEAAITFARNVPDANVVLCMGAAHEVTAFLKGVARENVFAEVSYIKTPLNGIEALVGQVGSERLVFGSHLPFLYVQTAVAKVREAYIGEDEKAAILWGNAGRVLG